MWYTVYKQIWCYYPETRWALQIIPGWGWRPAGSLCDSNIIMVKGPALMGSCQMDDILCMQKAKRDRSLLAVSKCCNVRKVSRKTRLCKAGLMWGLHILHNHAAAHPMHAQQGRCPLPSCNVHIHTYTSCLVFGFVSYAIICGVLIATVERVYSIQH